MTKPKQLALPVDLKPVLLISLRPKYWERIRSGDKRYEYRKSFPRVATHCYVYVSSPVAALQGFIDFRTPITGRPREVAAQTAPSDPKERAWMLEYFGERSEVFAAPILASEDLEPIPLSVLREQYRLHPPQNYLFLERSTDSPAAFYASYSRFARLVAAVRNRHLAARGLGPSVPVQP